MATITTQKLSGINANGTPLIIAQTLQANAETVHTAVNVAGQQDELVIDVFSISGSVVRLHMVLGSTLVHSVDIPGFSSPWRFLSGYRVSGGLLVKFYASVANQLFVGGYANRIVEP